jgi:hypothetical protein
MQQPRNPDRLNTMTGKYKKTATIIVMALILTVIVAPLCLASSQEPASITVVVPNAPDDIDITLNTADGKVKGYKVDKFMESQFHFYSFNCRKDTLYTINVSFGNVSEVVKLAITTKPYLNLYELDHKKLETKKGVSKNRVYLYTALRFTLTLLIESFIFYIFGFRKKKSWFIFLLINFIVLGVFNIWISSYAAPDFYMIMILILGAVFVFLVKGVSMVMLIDEKMEMKVFSSAMIASLLSIILIGVMMPYMPYI